MSIQGLDFNDDLTLGGPASVGYGKANLSAEVLAPLTEVAVSEQVSSSFPATNLQNASGLALNFFTRTCMHALVCTCMCMHGCTMLAA